MSVNVKPKQLVIAMDTDAAVFKDYKGAGLATVIYAANTPGDVLGQATGYSFPGTGVDFEWVELFYVVEISNFFGFPYLERRVGYTPSTHVRFQDPVETSTGSTSTTTPSTGTTGGTSTDTTVKPDVTIPVTVGSGEKIVLMGNEKVIKEKASLPTWAYFVLGGLGLIALILTGVAISNNQKKKGGKK